MDVGGDGGDAVHAEIDNRLDGRREELNEEATDAGVDVHADALGFGESGEVSDGIDDAVRVGRGRTDDGDRVLSQVFGDFGRLELESDWIGSDFDEADVVVAGSLVEGWVNGVAHDDVRVGDAPLDEGVVAVSEKGHRDGFRATRSEGSTVAIFNAAVEEVNAHLDHLALHPAGGAEEVSEERVGPQMLLKDLGVEGGGAFQPVVHSAGEVSVLELLVEDVVQELRGLDDLFVTEAFLGHPGEAGELDSVSVREMNLADVLADLLLEVALEDCCADGVQQFVSGSDDGGGGKNACADEFGDGDCTDGGEGDLEGGGAFEVLVDEVGEGNGERTGHFEKLIFPFFFSWRRVLQNKLCICCFFVFVFAGKTLVGSENENEFQSRRLLLRNFCLESYLKFDLVLNFNFYVGHTKLNEQTNTHITNHTVIQNTNVIMLKLLTFFHFSLRNPF